MSELPVHVVFRHEDFIIINKPVGVSVHFEDNQPGVVEQVKKQLNLNHLWLVHRLDKVTSGLLILALNADSAATLSALFANRQIAKYYLALSDKKPKKKQGAIIGDMEKSRNGTFKLCPTKNTPAITQFFSKGMQGKRLFILKPSTGKTHQLRVALKSISSPILGDIQYTGSPADRTYLHAYALVFNYQDEPLRIHALPLEGEYFHANLFNESVDEFSKPWNLPWPVLPSTKVS